MSLVVTEKTQAEWKHTRAPRSLTRGRYGRAKKKMRGVQVRRVQPLSNCEQDIFSLSNVYQKTLPFSDT